MKALIIAEKPSLMRAIEGAYLKSSKKYDADFTCFRGYFMELREPDKYTSEWGKPWRESQLPMIPDTFMFDVKSSCTTDAKKIKDMINSGGYDFIVNACDAGREGESIFWTFYNSFGFKLPVKRLWASDITDSTLSKALDNLLDYDNHLNGLKDASLSRMYFDWLIGMNLSRAASLKTKHNTSVGRVQTPTLNIVVMRDNEIENFKPEDFYELEADFGTYSGLWYSDSLKTNIFKTSKEVNDLKSKLGKKGKIIEMTDNNLIENAPALFSLAELQKDANRILGFTAKETLDLAQSLYENHKILSYPRTESRALSVNLAKDILGHLKAIEDVPEVTKYVKMILSEPKRITSTMSSKKYVDNAKVTDHHAIINTKIKPNLSRLTAKEKDLYILVIKKFVSIFMNPYVTNKTTIITEVDSETFKTVGSVLVDMGYREIYGSKSKDAVIPKVKKGDEFNISKFNVHSKQTKPPSPYNDRTLITAMQNAGKFSEDENFKNILNETKGLGTSATRDSIIEKLISKKMLERIGKSIRSTDVGKKIISILGDKSVASPDLTAMWETKLQDMENCKLSYDKFYNEMIEYTESETKSFLTSITTVIGNDNLEVIGKCPKCNSDALMTKKYVLCENYKKETNTCDFIIGVTVGGTKIPKTELIKIINGEKTKVMTFKSKAGKSFKAHILYDKNEGRSKYVFPDKESIGKCPKCGGSIIDKQNACSCDSCNFFIGKKILGTSLTGTDIKKLIEGKETPFKKFTKNGKSWESKLKYNKDFTKLDFIFKK